MSIDIMGAKAEAPATRAAKAAVRIFSVEYDLVETRHFHILLFFFSFARDNQALPLYAQEALYAQEGVLESQG